MEWIHRYRSLIRKIQMLRAQDGPYRFIVREWSGLTDLNLAARVLNVEFFRRELQPILLPIEKFKSIVVLAPHQDDETIGAGGALLIAAKAGAKINIIFITDSKSESDATRKSEIRNREAEQVCARLNATAHYLGILNRRPAPTVEDADRLAQLIRDMQPQVLMTPWMLDSPPKHRMTNHLLWIANCRRALPPCEAWGYQVHNAPLPNGYVDITDVIQEKQELLEIYQSQNEKWTNYTHQTMGMAAWNAHLIRSTRPRYLEVFMALPLHEHLKLIDQFYFQSFEETYRGDSRIIPEMKRLHAEFMSRSAASGKSSNPQRFPSKTPEEGKPVSPGASSHLSRSM